MRRRIAEENHIPLEIKECTYEGPCRGTCPRCEAEVRYLENSLVNRLKMGKVATVAGLALGLASCGGQSAGTDTTIPPMPEDSVHNISEEPLPEVPEGPETKIEVPDVGEWIVTGDMGIVEETPSLPEDTVYEEGGIDDEVFVIVEDEPEFPGGMEALYKFIQDNVQYPQLALDNGIEGKVYVTFVVEEDGSITNPRLLRDIGGGCGQEAIRVVKMMPKWKPGTKYGKPVRVQFNLPVSFTQSNESNAAPTRQRREDSVRVIVK